MPYFDDLGSNFEKPYSIFSINAPEFALFQSLVQKVKINLGPKMFDFRILRLEFESIIVIFEISILEFLLSLCLVQKKKSLNLEKICLYVAIFGKEFGNNIVIF